MKAILKWKGLTSSAASSNTSDDNDEDSREVMTSRRRRRPSIEADDGVGRASGECCQGRKENCALEQGNPDPVSGPKKSRDESVVTLSGLKITEEGGQGELLESSTSQ